MKGMDQGDGQQAGEQNGRRQDQHPEERHGVAVARAEDQRNDAAGGEHHHQRGRGAERQAGQCHVGRQAHAGTDQRTGA